DVQGQSQVSFSVTVTPTVGSTLDPAIRIFNANGAQLQSMNGSGVGLPETLNITLPTGGTYYIGVSSSGNVNYNPNDDSGATGGTTTGGYSLKATFTDLPATTQTLQLVSNDSTDSTKWTVLSYNGVSATVPVGGFQGIQIGSAGTQASDVFASLITIPALAGNVAVSGPDGGPFNITFINALAGTNVSLLTSSTPNAAVTAVDDRFVAPGDAGNVDNSSF